MARPIYYQWCQCQLCTYRGGGMSENLGEGQSGHVMGQVSFLFGQNVVGYENTECGIFKQGIQNL